MMLHNMWAVFRFEFLRTVTLSRLGVWLLLVLFPIFIVSVMKHYEANFNGQVFGMKRERAIVIAEHGVVIDIQFRNGRRLANVRFGQGPNAREVTGVPVPNHWSREEIANSYREILTRFGKAPATEPPPAETIDDTVWGWILLGLIPGVTTLLGLLLWATPLVQSELEGRTWIYLAVRPRGRAGVLLGKYLSAVTWTALAGWLSLSICVLIARPEYALRLWSVLFVIIGLACLGYGALYSLIGTIIARRAMVIAVAYTLIFEFLISFVPAVINQFTIQYRLRNLLVLLMDWRKLFPEDAGEALLGNQPTWMHLAVLCGMIAVMLFAAIVVIQHKEYVTAAEA